MTLKNHLCFVDFKRRDFPFTIFWKALMSAGTFSFFLSLSQFWVCVCLERQTISLIFKLWFSTYKLFSQNCSSLSRIFGPILSLMSYFHSLSLPFITILFCYTWIDLHNFLFIVDLYGHFKIFNEHFQCLKENVAFMLYVQIYPLHLCFVLWRSTFCWMRTQIMETNSLHLNPSSVPLWWKKHWTHSSCPNFPLCKMVNYYICLCVSYVC